MNRRELDDLFEEATSNSSAVVPEKETVESKPLLIRSRALDALINNKLPELVGKIFAYEQKRAYAIRVDGLIIGTGEADFTKGNTLYPLSYKGKRFQLVDVPGIEGDEGKYAAMVREAVAKAHLVIYVNGTNKKPEKATAEKIRSYLRLGTQVLPVINLRGNADAYEFEEDRISLEAHNGATDALKQTEQVLESFLDHKVLLPGKCVQGLLAFSALARDGQNGSTTIHPLRSSDLVIQQRNYQKFFVSAKAMYEFSQISCVAQVLNDKLGTFREDMIESNKIKVRELLVENIETLKTLLSNHEKFIEKIKPEFEKCRDAISNSIERFERLVIAGRKNLWDGFFNILRDDADEIVENNFGEKDVISSKINRIFKSRQEELKDKLREQFEKYLNELQQDVQQAMQRLLEDVARVELVQLINNSEKINIGYSTPEVGLGLNFGDYGWMAFNIGSYALTGFGIGSAFPVIGNVVGAIAGAVVGILVNLLSFFTSKEKRIRKAQEKVHEKIDAAWSEAKDAIKAEQNELFAPVRKQINDSALSRISQLDAELKSPIKLIKQQIELMVQTKNNLEKMPYGTIQTI